jgi:hypothetical protein
MSSTPLNSSVLGWWPIARNRPSASTCCFLPSRLAVRQLEAGDLALADVEHVGDVLFQSTSTFGFSSARCCMIFDARSASRRTTR